MANKKVSEGSEELAEFEVARPKGRPKVVEEEEELIPEELGDDDELLPEVSIELDAAPAPVAGPVAVTASAEEPPVQTATPVFDTEQSCTTVGPTVVIRGKIRSDENLVVFGRIEAGVKSTKDVRLEATGLINSDLHVRCVWVAGIVVGDIHATQLVELAPEARVIGDIYTSRLIVKDGAKFRGRVEMDGLQALEAVRPPVQAQAAAPKKTAKSSPAVAEVIWSDVEDLAPTPAHRQAAVTPQSEPAVERPAAGARAPAPAQIAVTQRVRQPGAAPPPKAPEKPAAPPPPAQAQAGDKPPADGEKGIGSWFRRQ
jgi:cytoskeletal protein CcmA (bactofilin family)